MAKANNNYLMYTTTINPPITNATVGRDEIDSETQAVMEIYYRTELASAITLVILAAITVPTNILLLSSIWRDPLKCFNKPTTPLVVGLAVADLLTGLTTEPFFAVYYVERYTTKRHIRQGILVLYQIGQFVSTVAISSSFLIVLVLSWSQCVAITYPHRYKQWISRPRITICVVVIWLYFSVFSVLHFVNIDQNTFLKADLALHPTLITIILFITLAFLFRSFSKQVRRKKISRGLSNERFPNKRQTENIERQFTIVTLYLAGILLASALPHVIVQYVWLYGLNTFSLRDQFYIFIVMRVRDLLLFVKVALDAFIYAWRLPMYRRALQKTMSTEGIKRRWATMAEQRERRCSARSTVGV
ncbi:dopamine receptor 2 [Nematostella vectensis]|uniref:dopamine receptor 2 n=1 Tax=Nematostella vectensis TaxID=45351 RepID=UPI002076FF6A|nr:dopamine receptor 2 [Nematostella vectensis]XP_032220364.2 dopamine receptor 2 [Nematostella vectensis]XP_032220365.2 dopamine receptor 2 [Nematostella vectensis]XP_032220367.2 dopamine receptor 2 [Nematostella vectensis]